MSEDNEIDVYQTNTFRKAFRKLTDAHKELVEDQIDLIIEDPEIGEQKKGDLSYLWVHKFKMDNLLVLLGYSWNEGKLEIHLLDLAPHENFYQAAKKRRKADLKAIK